MSLMTEEEFKAVLPATMRKKVDPILINSINQKIKNEEERELFKENLLSYTSVLKEGKFKMDKYINAVKYVSFKLLCNTNKDAYMKTFPTKWTKWLANGVAQKDIASYYTAYNKSKLVQLIYEQTLIPSYILNAPMFQQALNTQAYLMINARSEKVRSDSANSILTHLKRPETQKFELDIGLKEDKTLETLRQSTLELVEAQKKLLRSGSIDAQQVAEKSLINVTPDDP